MIRSARVSCAVASLLAACTLDAPPSARQANFEGLAPRAIAHSGTATVPADILERLPDLPFAARPGRGALSVSIAFDRGGPFPEYRVFAEDRWACREIALEPFAGGVRSVYRGCTLPDRDVRGDFDLDVELRLEGAALEVHPSITNRMSHGIADVRQVFRLDPAAMPERDRTYALFGTDEWIRDPIEKLKERHVDRLSVLMITGFLNEGEGRGHYTNRGSPRPMLSIHTPRFGVLVQDLDTDNALSGTLLLGSNDDGLEFGYLVKAPREQLAGNGSAGTRISLSHGFRATRLPGRADTANAWWDALHVFKAYARATGLIPDRPMRERTVPAEWARDCFVTSVNLGVPVSGFEGPGELLTAPALAYLDAFVGYYAESGQRNFCPLLWAWSAVGPYAPERGFDELLAGLDAIEERYGVEIHPTVYMHGAMVSTKAVGTPLEAAMMRDLRGQPFTWGGGLINVHADHPAFVAEVERTVRDMVARGIRGFYFDAPTGEFMPDYAGEGVVRDHHVAVRQTMQRVSDLLESLGGGVISSEAQRLGLPGTKGAVALVVDGSGHVPFTEALLHEEEISLSFGDVVTLGLSIAAADGRFTAGSTYVADDDIARLAIDGAVYGRLGMESTATGLPHFMLGSATTFHERAFFRRASIAMPNALRARREIPALRTGRLLRTPARTEIEQTMRMRPPVEIHTPTGPIVDFHPRTLTHVTSQYPAAFYRDAEHAGRHVLVVGNPTTARVVQRFKVARTDFEVPVADIRAVRIAGATVIEASADAAAIDVTIPSDGIVAVTFDAPRE